MDGFVYAAMNSQIGLLVTRDTYDRDLAFAIYR